MVSNSVSQGRIKEAVRCVTTATSVHTRDEAFCYSDINREEPMKASFHRVFSLGYHPTPTHRPFWERIAFLGSHFSLFWV
jgi:hypothetical protein